MRSSLILTFSLLTLSTVPVSVEGQSRPATARTPPPTVPDEMLPPQGKCRIWMEGVPPAQQPAPTDCATALRQKPVRGTIIYGPAVKRPGSNRFDLSVGDSSRPTPARDSSASRSKSRVPEGRDSAGREKKAEAPTKVPVPARKKPE